MTTDNVLGADNQQERLVKVPVDIAWYIVGFADGEGSFNVSLRKRADYGIGWKVGLSFNISQKDPTILAHIQQWFGCGTVRYRKDGVGYFEVCTFADIQNVVIPFFQTHPLKTKKQNDFLLFCTIAQLVFHKAHLTYSGMNKLLDTREKMNAGGKRKFSTAQILQNFRQESSETTRQIRQPAE